MFFSHLHDKKWRLNKRPFSALNSLVRLRNKKASPKLLFKYLVQSTDVSVESSFKKKSSEPILDSLSVANSTRHLSAKKGNFFFFLYTSPSLPRTVSSLFPFKKAIIFPDTLSPKYFKIKLRPQSNDNNNNKY